MVEPTLTNTADSRDPATPLANRRRRLVLRPAGVQECLLGEGHDVDLPAQRHLYFQLLSDVVYDGTDVHDGALA